MQINIIEIMKEILLDGRMYDHHNFQPKHPIIYNAYIKSNMQFEQFLKSCLVYDKTSEEANDKEII